MKHRSALEDLPGDSNRAIALRLLRRHRQLSRSEIAHRAGLSEASVSRIVSRLTRSRLVTEVGASRSTGGRPAARLQFDESVHHSVGVDIHDWETRVAVGTLSGRLEQVTSFPTPSSPMATLDAVAERVGALGEKRPDIELAGVGVSVRGLVNSRTGLVERGVDREWTRIPVREYLEHKLELPVYVDNNVRSAAFAEYHYGSPDVQDCHCLLFVMVGEGIGFSMVVNGELYYGQHMAAGEFGQMVIKDTGGNETHDRPGSLESLAADGATCARFMAVNGARKLSGDSVVASARAVAHRALAGDDRAREVLQETARYLGIGIANAIWGLDPDAVVVDGTIVEAWPVIAPVLYDQFADGREFLNFRNLILRPSALRGQAAMIGAAALPFQWLFAAGDSFSR